MLSGFVYQRIGTKTKAGFRQGKSPSVEIEILGGYIFSFVINNSLLITTCPHIVSSDCTLNVDVTAILDQ